MILTNKFKKNDPRLKLSLQDLFANVILSVTTFCMILWVPLIISLFTGDDKIGAIIDRYITHNIYAFVAKAILEVILNSLLIFIITTFIMYLKYGKKCRKLGKGIDFMKLLSTSITPTIFATSVSAFINLIPPVKGLLEILVAIVGGKGKIILMILLGFIMAIAHFFGMGLTSLPKC